MPYARLDDGFWMHPQIMAAGNTATGVFARMLGYCGRYLTDGLVPSNIVPMIEGADGGAIDTLEGLGLVQRLDSGAVFIPDYLDYNRSKAQTEADRAQARVNGKKGGRPVTRGRT